MFIYKSLWEEVRSLKGRLDDIEHQEFGPQIEEIQRANHALEQKCQGETEKLQKASHKIAVRLGMLQGIAAVLFAMLSGVAVYYIDRYRAENERSHVIIEQSHEIEVVRADDYDVMLNFFRDKLGDTLDRISLFAPDEEDRIMVAEVDELRQKLSRPGIVSEKFEALSVLTSALKLIVNEGKGKEASDLLDQRALPVSKDRFVASRALTLQAMTRIQANQQCDDRETTIALINGAIQKDPGVAAAFNLLGACQTEEAKASMYRQPEQWQQSGETIRAALRNNELAYQFKPSQWSRARFLNNRVWETSEFLLAALKQNKLSESLPWTDHKTIEEFFVQSVKDLGECQMLDQRRAASLETLAEMYSLEYAYYRNSSYRNDRKAEEAYEKMIQALSRAINAGLLRKVKEPGEAEKHFGEDDLLAPLFSDPENPQSLDKRIKAVIEQHVRFH